MFVWILIGGIVTLRIALHRAEFGNVWLEDKTMYQHTRSINMRLDDVTVSQIDDLRNAGHGFHGRRFVVSQLVRDAITTYHRIHIRGLDPRARAVCVPKRI